MACNIAKKKLDVNDYSFVHFTVILFLHYLVKCRSRSLAVYSNNEYWVAHASAQTWGQYQWDIQSRRGFETDAAPWHSCSIWSECSFFSAVPRHIAPKTQ